MEREGERQRHPFVISFIYAFILYILGQCFNALSYLASAMIFLINTLENVSYIQLPFLSI